MRSKNKKRRMKNDFRERSWKAVKAQNGQKQVERKLTEMANIGIMAEIGRENFV